MGYGLEKTQIEMHNVAWSTLEYENDRQCQNFEFIPTPLREALLGEADGISLFFSQPYLLYATLLVSNFQLAPFEIRRLTRYLAELIEEGDEESLGKLQDEIILNALILREGIDQNVFQKTTNVATHIGDNVNQRHTNIPVYGIKNPKIFKSAIIAATLLLEYGEIFEFTQRTHQEIESLFSSQVFFLYNLNELGRLPASFFITYDTRRNRRTINKQTLSTIIRPLFEAGFISREGHKIIFTKKNILQRKKRTVLNNYLLEILGENDSLEISYIEICQKLFDLYYTDPKTRTDSKTVKQNISKYLQLLKKEGNVAIKEVQQRFNETNLGHFSYAYVYEITQQGQEFLERVRLLIENPEESLGPAQLYCISENGKVKDYSQLTEQYKILLQDQLRRILNKPAGVE